MSLTITSFGSDAAVISSFNDLAVAILASRFFDKVDLVAVIRYLCVMLVED